MCASKIDCRYKFNLWDIKFVNLVKWQLIEDTLFNHRISVLLNYPYVKNYSLIEDVQNCLRLAVIKKLRSLAATFSWNCGFLFMISIVTYALCAFFKVVRFLKQDARHDISAKQRCGFFLRASKEELIRKCSISWLFSLLCSWNITQCRISPLKPALVFLSYMLWCETETSPEALL